MSSIYRMEISENIIIAIDLFAGLFSSTVVMNEAASAGLTLQKSSLYTQKNS